MPLFPILGSFAKKKKRCCITPRCVLCRPLPKPSGFQLVLASEFRELLEKARRCHCKGTPVVNIFKLLYNCCHVYIRHMYKFCFWSVVEITFRIRILTIWQQQQQQQQLLCHCPTTQRSIWLIEECSFGLTSGLLGDRPPVLRAQDFRELF